MGGVRDATGDYSAAFNIVAVLFVVAALFLWAAEKQPKAA